ncbi:MAG: cell surface protein SprA, partial [Candidatus Neomarinimicrobiota bacterium]
MINRATRLGAMLLVLTIPIGIHGQQGNFALYIPPQFRIHNPWVAQVVDPEPLPLHFPLDSTSVSQHLLTIPGLVYKRIAEFSRDWSTVEITETINDRSYAIPFIASAEWYFQKKLQQNRIEAFAKRLSIEAKEDKRKTGRRGRGKSIEVVGVNLGGLGRASLRVNGNVNISGKAVFQNQDLVRSSINEAQNTHIEFDQKQNLSIEGKIGDRITVKMDQDSERDFDWENNIRISYEGKEDDIVQQVEAGNISLSLPSTQFVTFSGQNKGLFGLKAISKLGPVDITSIASIEQTKKERQKYKGGTESKTQQIKDYEWVKNRYFFIHPWFRNGVMSDSVTSVPLTHSFYIPPYFPLKNGYHLIGNIVVRNFELYKRDLTNDPSAEVGVAYIDPNRPDYLPEKKEDGNFIRLERDVDYTLAENLGYVRMNISVNNDILGCTYDLVDYTTGDTVFSVGHGITPTDSTLSLLMLKTANPHPNDPNWDLMFKNVYDLGTTNINREGFAVRIVNNRSTPESDRDRQGVAYLTQFGLDSLDNNGQNRPDEIVDMDNGNIVNLVNGELHFPTYYPFALADSLKGGTANPSLVQDLGSGVMYTSSNINDIREDSRFTIEADYTNQSSTISLGFMLVEGSEEIRVNGELLQRGVDYQIDYFTGTIVLGEKASDPNANLEILYEKHELVSFDKKVILGSRAQMDFGKKSFLGATALYYNQSVINEKIDVGYEPTRNFIWDMNGRVEKELNGLTRFLDRLPIIETEKPSSFSLEGEIAQVLPNPNSMSNPATGDPDGVAYIDDFEGSKRSTTPPILRRYWKESSAPLNLETMQPYSQRNRVRMYFYNPFTQVRTKDIWPNQSTSLRAQNELTDILVLHQRSRPWQSQTDPDSLWSGITTSLYTGDYDQTQSKFVEIWVKGTEGKLEIDLGKISEDRDGNNRLNTEDIPEAGLTLGNGFLEPDEDTGLDGCFDEYEDGWGGCLTGDSTYQDYLTYHQQTGKPVPINLASDVDPEDPNGDNWYYASGSSDYTHVNGTEGNGTGKTIQEGGKYPDTEDLNQSGFLDRINDYFAKSFDLSDTTYLAGITIKDGQPTGWRLFRIPLSHFRPVDQIAWNEIQFLRLVWTGVDSEAVLQIAKIEITGNDWQEMGVAPDSSNTYTKDDSVFAVAVINTEDNANYTPPAGVKGEYDRVNEIRSKEQSLVLQFTDLLPHHKVAAKKVLLSLSGDRAKSYLTYNKMKMFVYGNSPDIGQDNTGVHFFLRFGIDDKNYYEIRQPVYQGWDETQNRNSVQVDLNWLTGLKLRDSTNIGSLKYRDTDQFLDSAGVLIYRFTDGDGRLTKKEVRIKGEPALNRVKFFIAGLENITDHSITGEVWLDELRLSGVKKDRGVAMRMQGKLNLADLGNTTIQYSRKDADFHVLQDRLGTNKTNRSFRINSSFQLDKFLPSFIGLRIPINASLTNTINQPKYFPGTDILVDKASPPDSILTKSTNINFSTSVAKAGKSDHKLIKYTLDNLKGSFSASRSLSSNEIMAEVRNENYSGKLSYNLQFGRNAYVKPLKWTRILPWVGEELSQTQVYYLPSSFSSSLNFNEKLVQKQSRGGKITPDDYNFGLSRDFGLAYKLTDHFTTNYKRTAKSDLDAYRGYAWLAVKNWDPGQVTNVTESLTLGWTPAWIQWFKPNFNYSAAYRWSEPLSNTLGGSRIGTNLRFTSNVSITPKSIVEIFYKPAPKPKPGGGRRRRRGEVAPPAGAPAGG